MITGHTASKDESKVQLTLACIKYETYILRKKQRGTCIAKGCILRKKKKQNERPPQKGD